MNLEDNSKLIVCFPGGTGGNFLSSALQSVYFNTPFDIDPYLGHCHTSEVAKLPNIFHGPTIDSFQQEIDEIQKADFSSATIYRGHYRNLVAIQQMIETKLGYEPSRTTRFITVTVDHSNENHIFFIAMMLKKKNNCFPDLSFDDFLEQTRHYVKSWYWVQNSYTQSNTIGLCLQDIFSPGLENKILSILNESQAVGFKQHHRNYLDIQKQIYPDLLALL